LHECAGQIEVLSFTQSKIQAGDKAPRASRLSAHEEDNPLQKEILDKTFRLSVEMRTDQDQEVLHGTLQGQRRHQVQTYQQVSQK
jgi:hypothetical protein